MTRWPRLSKCPWHLPGWCSGKIPPVRSSGTALKRDWGARKGQATKRRCDELFSCRAKGWLWHEGGGKKLWYSTYGKGICLRIFLEASSSLIFRGLHSVERALWRYAEEWNWWRKAGGSRSRRRRRAGGYVSRGRRRARGRGCWGPPLAVGQPADIVLGPHGGWPHANRGSIWKGQYWHYHIDPFSIRKRCIAGDFSTLLSTIFLPQTNRQKLGHRNTELRGGGPWTNVIVISHRWSEVGEATLPFWPI